MEGFSEKANGFYHFPITLGREALYFAKEILLQILRVAIILNKLSDLAIKLLYVLFVITRWYQFRVNYQELFRTAIRVARCVQNSGMSLISIRI